MTTELEDLEFLHHDPLYKAAVDELLNASHAKDIGRMQDANNILTIRAHQLRVRRNLTNSQLNIGK